jgi:hypothetical protein
MFSWLLQARPLAKLHLYRFINIEIPELLPSLLLAIPQKSF